MMVSFVLSFFPRDVLDEILNLIESVSEDFPSYSFNCVNTRRCDSSKNCCLLFRNGPCQFAYSFIKVEMIGKCAPAILYPVISQREGVNESI